MSKILCQKIKKNNRVFEYKKDPRASHTGGKTSSKRAEGQGLPYCRTGLPAGRLGPRAQTLSELAFAQNSKSPRTLLGGENPDTERAEVVVESEEDDERWPDKLSENRHALAATPATDDRPLEQELRVSQEIQAGGAQPGQLKPLGLGPVEPLMAGSRVREPLRDNPADPTFWLQREVGLVEVLIPQNPQVAEELQPI